MIKVRNEYTQNFPLFFKASFFLLTVFCIAFLITKTLEVYAVNVPTSVTVGNDAPEFTAGPAEDPASTTTTPTNVGSGTTFEATATDDNGDSYYLIICSTDSATATNGGAPTCGATQYCVSSSAVASGVEATCSRTALQTDAVSNTWYAFVCDNDSSSAECSTSSQGTGDSGTPFIVNHYTSFSSFSNDGPKNPGQLITFDSTSSDSTDGDTFFLLLCKTQGVTGTACDGGSGDTWCTGTSTTADASCAFNLPSVMPDDSYNVYPYIFDQHDLGSQDSPPQNTLYTFTVSNVAPVVSNVTINGGSAINLTEGTTKDIYLTATVTDNNSCTGGELASVLGYTYRSGVGYTTNCDDGTDADYNDCYPEISCTVGGADTCDGTTDASASYSCTVSLRYYADPTDSDTQYPLQNWLDTIKAVDDDTASHTLEVGTGVEMNSLTASSLGVDPAISYGNLAIEESNDPLDKITTTTPTGNVGLDQELSGAANMCTDYPTCSGGTPIGVAYQKYALAGSTAYASGTALSTSPTETELNVPKPITLTPTTKDTWWGILVPAGTLPGLYSGANTITAVKGEVISW